MRPGNIFRQDEYNRTLANLAKAGVWQSVNIQVNELPDSSKVDLVLELIPEKKFGFETALEASYSATSNTSNALTGNLIGLSANFSLLNRNIGREAIRMTHRLRAGVELNNSSRGANIGLINSNELSYSNNVTIPRRIPFFPGKTTSRNKPGETFINTNLSFNNRLKLFNLQSVNFTLGQTWPSKKNTPINTLNWTFRPLNVEFSYLFNQTDSFRTILENNPFLRYSYNTSFVIGMGAGFNYTHRNPKHLKSLSKERIIKGNIE
jgi:outer membrane protein assembly factor BamA